MARGSGGEPRYVIRTEEGEPYGDLGPLAAWRVHEFRPLRAPEELLPGESCPLALLAGCRVVRL